MLEKTDRFATRQTQAATPRATTPAATATVETTTASETMAEATGAPEPPSTASGITLRLRANADTWVEIRADSADGDVLIRGSSRRETPNASGARKCGHRSVPPRISQRA
jgi:hypothetical protein